jgi:hypothetical protein
MVWDHKVYWLDTKRQTRGGIGGWIRKHSSNAEISIKKNESAERKPDSLFQPFDFVHRITAVSRQR